MHAHIHTYIYPSFSGSWKKDLKFSLFQKTKLLYLIVLGIKYRSKSYKQAKRNEQTVEEINFRAISLPYGVIHEEEEEEEVR